MCCGVVISLSFSTPYQTQTSYTGPLLSGPTSAIQEFLRSNGLNFLASHVEINLGFCAFLFYASYYAYLEPVAGTAMGGVLFGLYLAAHTLCTTVGWGVAWKYALVAHVSSWYMQIHPGHGIFEKRKPALFDSLFQSFVLAPLFVWLEILFELGYRPALAKEMETRVVENIRVYREQVAAEEANKSKAN